MPYTARNPDIVLTNDDIFGYMLAEALDTKIAPFRREYHPDGAPAPRIDLNHTLTDYTDFKQRKILTSYRRRQLPDRDAVARHLTNYPRIIYNLTNPDTFDAEQVDVLWPYWINARADHNPKHDKDPSVRRRDAGRGMEYLFDALMFKAAGANRLLTFHPHFHREPGVIDVEGLEVVCLDAVPSMVRYARDEIGISDDCLVLNPDMKPAKEGKYDIALEFARTADLEIDHLTKQRLDSDATDTKGYIDAQGRDAAIVDDIFATFATVKGSVQNIHNVNRIYVIGVHPVLPRDGHSTARALISSDEYPVVDVVGTHTVDSDFSRIPVHDEVRKFYRGELDYIDGLSDDFPDIDV
ncbi:MAG: hypothetical protein JSV63_03740 [Candidatus Aenigmatarchaeota archaeon]|nr:MAG: hypothetical protein JSV63_03740 [Candidatus Aenigmarchaeota archaeon]